MARRVSIYFSWSRPQELGANLGILDNRYPTLFEFRRAIWPLFEHAADPALFSQDISGFLDHVVLSDFKAFDRVISEATGNPISIIQREGSTPPVRELDDDLLRNVDTLIIISLDHFRTEQHPSPGEIECIQSFVRRENSCLIICPHHDVGATETIQAKEEQHRHHGDLLVPGQQRIGGFGRSLLQALSYPIENRFGLNPGRTPDGSPTPLIHAEVDPSKRGILTRVDTFNLHPHLPHLWVPPSLDGKVSVLAQQAINLGAPPHPFIQEGNEYFSAFLHIPPDGARGGHIFVGDATLWSSAFGGLPSLQQLWLNVANF